MLYKLMHPVSRHSTLLRSAMCSSTDQGPELVGVGSGVAAARPSVDAGAIGGVAIHLDISIQLGMSGRAMCIPIEQVNISCREENGGN